MNIHREPLSLEGSNEVNPAATAASGLQKPSYVNCYLLTESGQGRTIRIHTAVDVLGQHHVFGVPPEWVNAVLALEEKFRFGIPDFRPPAIHAPAAPHVI